LRGGSRRRTDTPTAPYGASPDGRSGRARPPATATSDGDRTPPPPRTRVKKEKLSKDAYRRQKAAVDADLTRLHLRKNHLELAISDPAVSGNYVEMRRVYSELADIEVALATAEDAWLELVERAP
jgi:hypothetical protein